MWNENEYLFISEWKIERLNWRVAQAARAHSQFAENVFCAFILFFGRNFDCRLSVVTTQCIVESKHFYILNSHRGWGARYGIGIRWRAQLVAASETVVHKRCDVVDVQQIQLKFRERPHTQHKPTHNLYTSADVTERLQPIHSFVFDFQRMQTNA